MLLLCGAKGYTVTWPKTDQVHSVWSPAGHWLSVRLFLAPDFKKASADKNSFIAIISHMMNFRLGIAASPSARHRGVRCRFTLLSISVPIDSTEFTELSELFATRLDVHHFWVRPNLTFSFLPPWGRQFFAIFVAVLKQNRQYNFMPSLNIFLFSSSLFDSASFMGVFVYPWKAVEGPIWSYVKRW